MLPDDRITVDPIVNLGRYNALVGQAVAEGIAGGARPLLLGGTCSHLIGMLAGLQTAYGPAARIGLVWFDAHGDFNTPAHLPLRHARRDAGRRPPPVSATRPGASSPARRRRCRPTASCSSTCATSTREEAALIAATDATIARFGADGAVAGIAAATAELASRVDHLYLHVDADVLDAAFQPNHPSAEPGGPDVETVAAALRAVMATGLVRAFAVVSVDPTGPEGERSLRSGRALVLAGMTAWAATTADV